MSTLDYLTTVKTGFTVKEAVPMLALIADRYHLEQHEKLALAALIQATRKQTLAKTKLDNPFKLASLFTAKKDVRYYLNAVYSTGTHLLASSGHYLIKIQHACPTGFYTALGEVMPDTSDWKYPNFTDKALKEMQNGIEYPISDGELSPLEVNIKTIEVREYKIEGDTVRVNEDYINLLRKIGVAKVTASKQGVYFSVEKLKCEGVVMYMRK